MIKKLKNIFLFIINFIFLLFAVNYILTTNNFEKIQNLNFESFALITLLIFLTINNNFIINKIIFKKFIKINNSIILRFTTINTILNFFFSNSGLLINSIILKKKYKLNYKEFYLIATYKLFLLILLFSLIGIFFYLITIKKIFYLIILIFFLLLIIIFLVKYKNLICANIIKKKKFKFINIIYSKFYNLNLKLILLNLVNFFLISIFFFLLAKGLDIKILFTHCIILTSILPISKLGIFTLNDFGLGDIISLLFFLKLGYDVNDIFFILFIFKFLSLIISMACYLLTFLLKK